MGYSGHRTKKGGSGCRGSDLFHPEMIKRGECRQPRPGIQKSKEFQKRFTFENIWKSSSIKKKPGMAGAWEKDGGIHESHFHRGTGGKK